VTASAAVGVTDNCEHGASSAACLFLVANGALFVPK